jgi:hypothetical protein
MKKEESRAQDAWDHSAVMLSRGFFSNMAMAIAIAIAEQAVRFSRTQWAWRRRRRRRRCCHSTASAAPTVLSRNMRSARLKRSGCSMQVSGAQAGVGLHLYRLQQAAAHGR